MLGAISLQEDIMGMEDRFEISTILDTLRTVKKRDPLGSWEYRRLRGDGREARDGNTVIVGIRWYLSLWKSRKECKGDMCEKTLYKT